MKWGGKLIERWKAGNGSDEWLMSMVDGIWWLDVFRADDCEILIALLNKDGSKLLLVYDESRFSTNYSFLVPNCAGQITKFNQSSQLFYEI